jgi:hypothetical protein
MANKADGTLIFRASLDAKLYRDIEVRASTTLYKLAAAIIAAYDFDLDHAFGFYSSLTKGYGGSPKRYELFADMGEADPGILGVEKTQVTTAFPRVGAKMVFVFDYGDDWRFGVELFGTGIRMPKTRYPRVLAKVGEAPEQYPAYDDEDE